MGRTSEIDLIGVDDAGWAEHKAAHIGPGLIEYEENGITYRVSVQVHYPDLGLYDAMPFDEQSIVDTLMLSEDQNVFYIALSPEKIDEGLRFAKVNETFGSEIENPSVTTLGEVKLSDDGTYAMLTVDQDKLNAQGYYHFEAEITDVVNNYNGTWGRSVRVENDMPGLYFCYGERDGSTQSWFINFDQIDSEWYTVPGHNKVGSFYFGTKSEIAAGNAAPLTLNDLTFVGDALEAENLQDNYQPTENLLIVDCTGFDGEYIRYTKDGIHYDMPVRAELPNIGFYSTNVAEQSSFIYRQNPFTVTETNDRFYLAIADTDRYRLVSVADMDAEIAGLFDVSLSNDQSSMKFILREGVTVPNGNFSVQVNCERLSGDSWHAETRYATLSLENGMPGLYYCPVERDQDDSWFINYEEVRNDWYTTPGTTKRVVFFFGLPEEIQAGKVPSLNEDDLKFYKGMEPEELEESNGVAIENAYRVRCTAFGTKGISYTADGVTYYIPVDAQLPDVGFYNADTASEDAYIFSSNPYTVTEDDRIFYILPDDPDAIRLTGILAWYEENMEDLFDTAIASDGSSIKFTVKDGVVVPNTDFGVEVEFEVLRADGSTETHSRSVWAYLENGQPALMFRHLEWDDEEQEWVVNKKNPLETVVDFDLGEEFPLQFYYGTEDDCIKVDPEELTLPKGVLTGSVREGVYWLCGDGFWTEGEIEYTNPDGEIVKMKAYSEQPSFAFYSSDTASKETWLDRDEITMYTDTPVYIIPRSTRTITGVEYIRNTRTDSDATDQFVIDIAADGSYAAIRLNEDDKPTGNTHYQIRVNDLNGWWTTGFRLNRGDLPQLTTPTNLVWHKQHEQWEDRETGVMNLHTEERMGSAAFEVHGLCQNRAEIEFYSAADGYTSPVLTGGWGFGDLKEKTHFSITDFIYADMPSGTYKFRVRNEGDGTDYRSSEWSAMSDAFVYTQPTTRLEAPDSDEFYWEKADDRYLSVWQGTEEDAAGYYEIYWYYRNEEGDIVSAHSGTFDIHADAYDNLYRSDLSDWALNEYGDTEYYFHVRAIPRDITQYRMSKWSGYSPALAVNRITDNVNDQLDDLIPDTSAGESTSVQDVQDALQHDTANLRAAMDADLNGDSGTLDRIAELEKLVSDNVDQKIDAKNSAPQAIQDIASGVTMVGATLNLADKNPETGKTPTVTLELDAPKKGIVIDEQQHNAVQFSMKLRGAVNHDDVSDAQQQLIVPVVIDMPVPEGINPDFLVVLHKMMDGSIEQMRPYIYWDAQKVCHARFVVDSFSDFALVEYNFGFFDEDGETISEITKVKGDEDFKLLPTGAAEGATVTFESSNTKIADVDEETGLVEINKTGEVTITATASATEVYPEVSASYTLIIEEEETSGIEMTEIMLFESGTDTQLGPIPNDIFDVRIYVEGLESGDECVIMLAGYTVDGQMDDLQVLGGRVHLPDGTCYYDAQIDNSDGRIYYFKAMAVNAFGVFTPVCDPVYYMPVIITPPAAPAMALTFSGNTATLTVTGDFDPTDEGSYIEVQRYDAATGAVPVGYATYVGQNDDGSYTYTYTNTDTAYGDFFFWLYAYGISYGNTGCYLEGTPAIDPVIDNITVDGNKATLTVTGDMDVNNDSIRAFTWDGFKYSFLGFAELENSESNVHTYTFANTTGSGCVIQFRLTIGGAEADIESIYVPAAGETEDEPTVSYSMDVSAVDNTAYITVTGALPLSVRVAAYTLDGTDYTYVGDAEWGPLGGEVYPFTFVNPYDYDCSFVFRLLIDDEIVAASSDLGLAATPPDYTMEVMPCDNRADITVYGDLGIDDYVMVHALINDEYYEVGQATYEVLGDGMTTFSFENPYAADYTFLFQLWVDGAFVTYQTVDLTAGGSTISDITFTVEVDGSNATITVTGAYDMAAELYAMGNIDGNYGQVGVAACQTNVGDLHVYTFTNPYAAGYDFDFRLMLDGKELACTDTYWLSGNDMLEAEW